MDTLTLDGRSLRLEQLQPLLEGKPLELTLGDEARRLVERARSLVEKHVRAGDVVYGLTTGFGKLKDVAIDAADLERLQRNLILSHCCGCGDPMPVAEVRIAQVLRLNGLSRGHSGVRVELLETLIRLFEKGFVPEVPQKGSVGASGDLAPLAHMAAAYMGAGYALLGGKRMSAADALGEVGEDEAGRRIETFEPGMIEYLPAGKDVRFAAPASSGGYPEYMRLQLHAIASGLGLTYELLTGDLSQVNYSSIRAGLIEFRRRMEALQGQVLIPGLCNPVWRRFVEVTQAVDSLPAGNFGVEWTAPRFEAVDPLKDAKADIMSVRAGFMTLKEAIARNGYDPSDVLAEIADTNAKLDELGLVLDSDPRKATQTGAAKIYQEGEENGPNSDGS